jgi:hypothetical protein
MTEIKISRSCKGVNLNVNGPLIQTKVVRNALGNKRIYNPGWYTCRSDKSNETATLQPVQTSSEAAETEALKVISEREQKESQLRVNHQRLKERIREGAKQKTLAFQKIIQQYHSTISLL